jgi:hypothetical protein
LVRPETTRSSTSAKYAIGLTPFSLAKLHIGIDAAGGERSTVSTAPGLPAALNLCRRWALATPLAGVDDPQIDHRHRVSERLGGCWYAS